MLIAINTNSIFKSISVPATKLPIGIPKEIIESMVVFTLPRSWCGGICWYNELKIILKTPLDIKQTKNKISDKV